MGRYKAVLFDYDGTIVNTNAIITASWQHMAKKLAGHELNKIEMKKTFGLTMNDAFFVIADVLGFPKDDATIRKMSETYSEYQETYCPGPYPLFPGIKELVLKLHEEGIKTGIVTSRIRQSTIDRITGTGIENCFDCIITAESTDKHKPSPEPALICCRNLGVDPKDALMIGDSRFDMGCGNSAGCDTCFVCWSFSNKREEVEAFSPATYYVNNTDEILSLVGLK